MFKSSCAFLLIGGFLLAQEIQAASIGGAINAASKIPNLNQPYQHQLEDLILAASQNLQAQALLPPPDKSLAPVLTSGLNAKDDLVTSIKKLKEQSELYQMINDMLKAESQVQKMPYTMDQDEYEDEEGQHDDQDHHDHHHEEEVDIKRNVKNNTQQRYQAQNQRQLSKTQRH